MPCCEQGQQELGNAWTEIAKRLPGRGGMDCRDHFRDTSSMKRLHLAAGDDSTRSDTKKKKKKISGVSSVKQKHENTEQPTTDQRASQRVISADKDVVDNRETACLSEDDGYGDDGDSGYDDKDDALPSA